MGNKKNNSGRVIDGTWDNNAQRLYYTNLRYSPGALLRMLDGRKRVVPVLFIPGIMGSKLRIKNSQMMAWDPPNNLIQDIATLIQYIFMSAETRAKVLDPDNTEVCRNTAFAVRANKETGTVDKTLRGWESVWDDGYTSMRDEIEEKLNADEMPEGFDDPPFSYGLTGDNTPLTSYDFNFRLRRYRYEVWGGGYNWLQSNDRSADDLWKYVEDTILKAYPEDILNEEGKILIVTHSMGGLVARAMCKTAARAARILGVVHTVMPALGAPAAYKHIRAGFEGIQSIVLGYNAAHTTMVLSAAQGGMELLPFAAYQNGGSWLICPKDIKDADGSSRLLPWGGDPYTTIYKSTEWYGIVPYYHEHMLRKPQGDISAREKFDRMIDYVQSFHESIQNVYHPVSFAAWGNFEEMKAWGEVVWERRPIPFYKLFTSRDDEHKDTQLGRVYQGDYMADIQPAECPGDGTVPSLSAEDQKRLGSGRYFIHTRNVEKSDGDDYEHSMCFEHKMMKWSVVYSLARIVLETLGKV